MRITRVTTHRLPGAEAAEDAGTLLVRVETDAGLHGWGESLGGALAPTMRDVLDRLVGPACLGADARDIAAVTRGLARRFQAFGRNGPVSFAVSAIDIALWDIRARAAGRPLHALLGDAGRAAVPVLARLPACEGPEAAARMVRDAAARGHRQVWLPTVDLACIRAARQAGPGMAVTIGAGCAFEEEGEAVQFCEDAAAFGAACIEDPIWPPEDIPALARIRAASPLPVAAGGCSGTVEEFCRMFELRAVDVARPAVAKVGGISAMLEIAELAREAGVRLLPQGGGAGPALLATQHLLAAMEEEEALDIALDPAAGVAAALPGRPGLGYEPPI